MQVQTRKNINRTHIHTPTEINTPDTDTHTHTHDKNNTPNPQTNTPHKHLTTRNVSITDKWSVSLLLLNQSVYKQRGRSDHWIFPGSFSNPVVSVGVRDTAVVAAAGGLTTGWWDVVLECFSSHPLRVSKALALIRYRALTWYRVP